MDPSRRGVVVEGRHGRVALDRREQCVAQYKDGAPSSPGATDMTPSLRIDPSVVRPPDAPELAQVTAGSSAEASVVGELERLTDLHARGALSDEQFEAAKARLLGS
jgi:hypothetical protein